jgi:hypothetical protein
MEPARRDVVGVIDRLFLAADARGRGVLGFECDPGALGEHAHRVDEIHVVVQLHETDHVACGVAAETLEEAAIGMHVERRRFLAVKRTQADEIVTALT